MYDCLIGRDQEIVPYRARQLRNLLCDLGPSFIKAGQVASLICRVNLFSSSLLNIYAADDQLRICIFLFSSCMLGYNRFWQTDLILFGKII